MHSWQKRIAYLSCAAVVVALGLASRRYAAVLPDVIAQYAGDTLWALMVFLATSAAFPSARTSRRGTIALALAWAVELSQLYQAPWIDAVRSTRLGGLALGFDFVWTDLICYSVGVLMGVVIDASVRDGSDHP